jgi:hypothetical protein
MVSLTGAHFGAVSLQLQQHACLWLTPFGNQPNLSGDAAAPSLLNTPCLAQCMCVMCKRISRHNTIPDVFNANSSTVVAARKYHIATWNCTCLQLDDAWLWLLSQQHIEGIINSTNPKEHTLHAV